MKRLIATTILAVFFAQGVLAQVLVPATSEDLNEFDRQVSQAQTSHQPSSKPAVTATTSGSKKSAHFGAAVTQEAKNMKNLDKTSVKKMGQWVNDQRRKTDQNTPVTADSKGDASESSAAAAAVSTDASASSPANAEHGNSANAPGHAGKNRN